MKFVESRLQICLCSSSNVLPSLEYYSRKISHSSYPVVIKIRQVLFKLWIFRSNRPVDCDRQNQRLLKCSFIDIVLQKNRRAIHGTKSKFWIHQYFSSIRVSWVQENVSFRHCKYFHYFWLFCHLYGFNSQVSSFTSDSPCALTGVLDLTLV